MFQWIKAVAILSLAGIMIIVSTSPVLAAPERATTFLNEHGATVSGIRCGTQDPTPEEMSRIMDLLNTPGLQEDTARAGMILIPVAFHVVRHNDGSADVTDLQIQDQIDVLNDAYAGSGYQFELIHIGRTDNTAWSTHTPNSFNESAMKSALAVDPATTLNIYSCNIGGGILGYSYLPVTFPEENTRHGVVVLYSSLPGGTAFPYDEGDTGTHEVGHYLGLYHTFEGGCSFPGDLVDDTPYESTPAFGCPAGRDTCPSPGLDPIYNFMDYTDDACMDEFTLGQAEQMDAMVSLYKPTLWQGGSQLMPDVTANGSDTPITIPQGTPLSVSVSLNPGNLGGTQADWWILAQASSMAAPWYRYDLATNSWKGGIIPSSQDPLVSLPPTQVLNMSTLPPGNFTFYFGIDLILNGTLDLSQTTYDNVEVTITP